MTNEIPSLEMPTPLSSKGVGENVGGNVGKKVEKKDVGNSVGGTVGVEEDEVADEDSFFGLSVLEGAFVGGVCNCTSPFIGFVSTPFGGDVTTGACKICKIKIDRVRLNHNKKSFDAHNSNHVKILVSLTAAEQ